MRLARELRTHPDFPIDLLPGDVLLYAGDSIMSWAIRVKTWMNPVTHVELVSLTTHAAYASRDGQGVRTYALERENLHAIVRFDGPLDMRAVMEFHGTCRGQRYDWFGLFRFFTWGQQSDDKQFCSEYVTRLLRVGGVDPFPRADADLISPAQYLHNPLGRIVWCADDDKRKEAA